MACLFGLRQKRTAPSATIGGCASTRATRAPRPCEEECVLSINPATGESLATYDLTPWSDASGLAERAERAARDWSRLRFSERAAVLRKAGRLLRERSRSHAELIAREMGKPVAEGK